MELATRKRYNIEIVQHEQNSSGEKYNMLRVQQQKNAKRRKRNLKSAT